jgi:hypothetical protein
MWRRLVCQTATNVLEKLRSFAVKTEAAGFSETSLRVYQTTRHQVSESHVLVAGSCAHKVMRSFEFDFNPRVHLLGLFDCVDGRGM